MSKAYFIPSFSWRSMLRHIDTDTIQNSNQNVNKFLYFVGNAEFIIGLKSKPPTKINLTL